MQSLLNDPGVARYRQYELEEAVKIVEELSKDTERNIDFITGAMYMLRKCLHMPIKWGKSKESKEAARNMVAKDLKEFHSRYMRIFLE